MKTPRRAEFGYTLFELMVALSMSAILMSGVMSSYINMISVSADHEVVARIDENARTILEMVVFDLRMAGTGMPIGQDDFAIGDALIGEAPLPVLLDSTTDYLRFRLNETGFQTTNVFEFIPSEDLYLYLASTAGLKEGNILYVSDAAVDGHDGFRGQIRSIAGNTVRMEDDYTASTNAIFPAGSSVSPVNEITYQSFDDWSGVVRAVNGESIQLAENTRVSFTYLNRDRETISLPLSDSEVADSLYAVDVVVWARSEEKLSDGDVYQATAKQRVVFRSLRLRE
ncbi:MAG: prepilin-type N-terminal cleavage/methylation domain-containing protein [bacterium]|nr:prepilin-type N-terminal cleavage/methylation domain-containing protein [bacterium]